MPDLFDAAHRVARSKPSRRDQSVVDGGVVTAENVVFDEVAEVTPSEIAPREAVFSEQRSDTTGSNEGASDSGNVDIIESAAIDSPNDDSTNGARSARHVDEYSEVMRHELPTTNPFKAFSPKPENIFFDSQHHEEKVILLLRQHPITQTPWIVTTILLLFVPLLFNIFPFFAFLPIRFQMAANIGWYALVFTFALESFLMWFFNIYIITDERIIDVDFHSLIYKNISAAKLDHIEDISATTGGALGSIFNYGTIRAQTAGTNAEFEFENVPQPAKVTALLNELLLEEEREKMEGKVN